MSSSESADTLSYAVRLRVVLKYLGQLFLTLGVLGCAPLIASLLFAEYQFTAWYAAIATGYLLAGFFCSRFPTPKQLQTNEALVVVALAFLVAPIVSTLPLVANGFAFHDALFEAVSAVTTTGLSTLGSIESAPRTFLFARAWAQWYGGLGIAILSVIALASHHTAARRLLDVRNAESLAMTTRTYARRVLTVYVVLTIGAFLVIWAVSGTGLHAGLHALSAISTGGFSSFDASVAGFDSKWVIGIVAIVSTLGAVSLPLYHEALRKGPRRLLSDPEFKALVVLLALLTGILSLMFWLDHGGSVDDALFHGFSFAVFAQTTTGFSTLSTDAIGQTAKLVLILAMLIGGSVGSTAGGIKLYRLLVLLALIRRTLRQSAMPSHAVVEVRVGEKSVETEEINWIFVFMALFVFVIFVSWIPFVALGYGPLDSLFEVVSAACTVGLSTGISNPDLPILLKYVLCIDMWLGRLELIVFLVLLYPATWRGKTLPTK